ncbi:hypothetical protein BIY26_07625 [Brenneria goodwinii]|uniref:Uncharacterized protein n=1 Tax=Brenneria goodwinii TaxID=1109412 RepID=A0AAE8EQ54_9GAMM|nr:hypothetical protein AWC36_03080 [Brenneria goodwinii]RLM19828.1 hypothetical protein BIY28_15450 [Brenneria goodwinii]RLM26608.1 hypothetical protein BIY26_07625 [Brenneria goodwinii]
MSLLLSSRFLAFVPAFKDSENVFERCLRQHMEDTVKESYFVINPWFTLNGNKQCSTAIPN